MPVFQYVALDSQGVEIKDEVEALSEKEAISKIRTMGYFPTKVRPKGATKGPASKAGAKPKRRRGAGAKVKVKYITQFARQLSTLQDAGLPILRSLRILEEQQKAGSFKRIIGYVADDIEGGSTLSEAFGKYPRAFDRLFVNMVAAGEAGGVLDQILSKLADFKEKAMALRRRVVGAIVYPTMVISFAGIILLFIMLFIVPKFEDIFKKFDIKGGLPPLTQVLIAISNFVGAHWYLIPIVPIGVYVGLKLVRATQAGRSTVDWLKMKTPIVGSIVNRQAIATFARTLGTLIASGVPILEALNITRETVGNAVVAKALGNVHDSIREGESIAGPLRASGVVEPIVVNMVDVGEETGELDKMLVKVADTYDDEVDHLVGSLVSALEPVMIIFLGGTIGFIVIALFLPLVKLIEEVGQKG